VKVLLIGRDPTLYGGEGSGDAPARHRLYAERLRARCGSDSAIRIVTQARPGSAGVPVTLGDGVTVFPILCGHRVGFQRAARAAIAAALEGWQPDLVSTQTPFQDGLVGLRLARRLGKPLLVQVHFDFCAAAWRRQSLLNRLRHPLGRYVLRRADRVRVVSPTLRRRLVEELGLPAERIHVVPVGVTLDDAAAPMDRAQAQAQLAPQLAGRPVVLYVGRLAPEKNLGLWLQVARAVLAERPETRFLIVGDGPEHAALARRISSEGLDDAVVLAGALPYEKLPLALAASDILLLTSNHEGYGRVIVEANLAGLPAVSTRCGGPEDLIRDGETGYLRPRGDAEGLTRAVLQLLRDPALARRLGECGRRHVRGLLSMDTLADRLIDCWTATVRGGAVIDVFAAAAPTAACSGTEG